MTVTRETLVLTRVEHPDGAGRVLLLNPPLELVLVHHQDELGRTIFWDVENDPVFGTYSLDDSRQGLLKEIALDLFNAYEEYAEWPDDKLTPGGLETKTKVNQRMRLISPTTEGSNEQRSV